MCAGAALMLAAVAVVPRGALAGPPATPATPTPTTPTTMMVPGPDGPIPVADPPPGFPVPPPPARDALPLPLPDWLTAAQTTGGPVKAEHGATELLSDAKNEMSLAQIAQHDAQKRLADAHRDVVDERAELAGLDAARRDVLDRMRARAVRAYIVHDGAAAVADIVGAASVTESARRAIYAEDAQGLEVDRLKDVDHQMKKARKLLKQRLAREQDAAANVQATTTVVDSVYRKLLMLSAAAGDPKHGGRVFPVDGPFDFVDSFDAFRPQGAPGNKHSATDIMSPGGTPVVAIETGTLEKVGWNTLGGWRLWIRGASGAGYYYAHLSAYAPGLTKGMQVVAGQYLGRVGNTGDAAGGPTHLHFEVHLPPGDVQVNPYPLLCLLAGAPVPPIPPPETTTTTTTTTTVPSGPH